MGFIKNDRFIKVFNVLSHEHQNTDLSFDSKESVKKLNKYFTIFE